MPFSGKVVIVTGGSSGIGADAAREFAKLGARVVIVGRNEERLKEMAEKIIADGSLSPLSVVADVSKDPEKIISETIQNFGRLDVLVNNAGIAKWEHDSLIDFDANLYDEIMDVNLKSVVILTNLAIPYLEKTKGNIVNVSSIAGLIPSPTQIAYFISKAGVNHLTKCAAVALGSKGIRVNAIEPAIIRTPIFDTLGINESNSDAFFAEHQKYYLTGRVGNVSDTSSAIIFLAKHPFMTGILLPVDGGFLCCGYGKKRYSFFIQFHSF